MIRVSWRCWISSSRLGLVIRYLSGSQVLFACRSRTQDDRRLPMALTTSPAYQIALWILFLVVVAGWSKYFHVLHLARQVIVLPSLSVVSVCHDPYRVRAL